MTPRFPALLTTLALTACCAAASAQEMSLPTFALGDRWAFRETDLLTKNETGRWTETVTAIDAADYWIDSRRSVQTTWRGDTTKAVHREQFLVDAAAPNRRGKTITTNDAGCAYPWPLKVGMKFECTEGMVWPNGWKIRYALSFTVAAAETVQTAAGSFDTLRLEARGNAINDTTNGSSSHERTIWLSPAAKREVKHEIRTRLNNGTIFRVEGRELVEFSAGKP